MDSLHALPHKLILFMKNVRESILFQLSDMKLRGKKISVAFSGGSDSVCLLHALNSLSSEMGFSLSAIHVNHHLRGAEADSDAQFAVNFCRAISVPIIVLDVFVNQSAKKGESTELAARRLRYEAFEKVDTDYIATAHNADDSLETFLINFSRGSGLKGLCGIPSIRDRYIRPIINCSKREILSYCKECGLEFVTDSSNLSDDYTRNRIRHHVIPELKKVFPEIISVSIRNFQLLKKDNEFLNNSAENLYNEAVCEQGLKLTFLSSHDALVSRVILKYCFSVTKLNCDYLHLEQIISICKKGKGKIELFSGYFAKVKNGILVIEKEQIPTFSVKTELLSVENFNNLLKINNLLLKDAIDYDKIVGELVFRTRLSNDRIRPIGRGISKPLRKLQSEKKIDTVIRDSAPVAADDCGAVWGYLVGVDERLAIDINTKTVLIFKVYKS